MIIPDDVFDVVMTLHTRHIKAIRTISEAVTERGRLPRSILAGLLESEDELSELLVAIQQANSAEPPRAI